MASVNLTTKEIMELAPLHEATESMSMIEWNGFVYAVGGSEKKSFER